MEAFKAKNLPLHVLINNAGLQAPYDDRTEEGFEVTIALVASRQTVRTQLSAVCPKNLLCICALLSLIVTNQNSALLFTCICFAGLHCRSN